MPGSSDLCRAFIIFECFLVNIPAVLFILGAGINFKNVRSIGFNRVVKYSFMFKVKLVICWIMMGINVIVILCGLFGYDKLIEPNHFQSDQSCSIDQNER